MKLSFIVKEAFLGFRRAKLSTMLSVITIGIALTLLGVFAIITKNGADLVADIRSRMELEAFLSEGVKGPEVESLRNRILSIAGVENVVYISKEEAARIFREEFGEDISRVLEVNPLPASFKISLQEDFRTAEKVGKIQQEIQQLRGIDDVVYRKALLEFIDRQVRMFTLLAIGLGALVTLSAVSLISKTIRIALSSRREVIQTLKLVGGTPGYIRLPFLLEGIAQGLLGGLVASAVIYLGVEVAIPQFAPELNGLLFTDIYFYAGLVAAGLVLGLLASAFSVRKLVKQPMEETSCI